MQLVWAVLALVAICLCYDLLRRERPYIPRKDHERLREDHAHLSTLLEQERDINSKTYTSVQTQLDRNHAQAVEQRDALREHTATVLRAEREERGALEKLHAELRAEFDGVCQQWRAKVLELEAKCDRVVVEARNELAGDIARVTQNDAKGWRAQ